MRAKCATVQVKHKIEREKNEKKGAGNEKEKEPKLCETWISNVSTPDDELASTSNRVAKWYMHLAAAIHIM